MQYRSMTPKDIARGRMLIYCIQSEGLVSNYYIACCFHGYNNMFSALKNCMNVCPGPQKLYNSKHVDTSPTKRDCITYTVPCIP